MIEHVPRVTSPENVVSEENIVIPEKESPGGGNVDCSKVVRNELESIIGSFSLVSDHSVSKDTEFTEKVNDDVLYCTIVKYIEKTPSVGHNVKEPFFSALSDPAEFFFRRRFNKESSS